MCATCTRISKLVPCRRRTVWTKRLVRVCHRGAFTLSPCHESHTPISMNRLQYAYETFAGREFVRNKTVSTVLTCFFSRNFRVVFQLTKPQTEKSKNVSNKVHRLDTGCVSRSEKIKNIKPIRSSLVL